MHPCFAISVSADPSCKLDRLGIQLEHFDVTASRIMLLFFLEGIVDYLDVMTSLHRRKLQHRDSACHAPVPMTLWCVTCSLDRYTLQMQRLILLFMAAYGREYKITKQAIDHHSHKEKQRMLRARKLFMQWKRKTLKNWFCPTASISRTCTRTCTCTYTCIVAFILNAVHTTDFELCPANVAALPVSR